MPDDLIAVLPKNYRSIVLQAIAGAGAPVVIMDRRQVIDFSEAGPLTQASIRACRDFIVRDGTIPILGFHDHPNEMWIAAAYAPLAERCATEGWLQVQGSS